MNIAKAEVRDEHKRPDRETVLRGHLVTPVELSVLIELGLTDFQLADYFRVTCERIVGLKTYYGLTGAQ